LPEARYVTVAHWNQNFRSVVLPTADLPTQGSFISCICKSAIKASWCSEQLLLWCVDMVFKGQEKSQTDANRRRDVSSETISS